MKRILWEVSKDMKDLLMDFFKNNGADGGMAKLLTSLAITVAILVVYILVYIILKKYC